MKAKEKQSIKFRTFSLINKFRNFTFVLSLFIIYNTNLYGQNSVGIISTFAGNGTQGNSGDGGLATNAQIDDPSNVFANSMGDIYFRTDHSIRKIDHLTGIITTIIGNNTIGYSPDGTLATNALLGWGGQIVIDANNNLYFTDSNPIMNSLSNTLVRKIDYTTGLISTIAGTGVLGNNGDGGLAINAQVNPLSLVIKNNGDLFFSSYDGQYSAIRKIDHTTGIISIIAGSSINNGYSGDGGLAQNALLDLPLGLALSSNEDLYFTDQNLSIIRKIDNNTSIISTVAGIINGGGFSTGDGGLATNANLSNAATLFISNNNDVYVTDGNTIRKIDNTTGIINTVVGNGTQGYSNDGELAINSKLQLNGGAIYVDNNAVIYLPDGVNHKIRRVSYHPCSPSSLINFFCSTPSIGCLNNSSQYLKFNGLVCNGYIDAALVVKSFWGTNLIAVDTVNINNDGSFKDSTLVPLSLMGSTGLFNIKYCALTLSGTSITELSPYVNDTINSNITIATCGNLQGAIYNDANNDCNQNPGELGIANIPVKASMGTNVYIAWTDALGNYAFGTIPTGNYLIQINGSPSGYTMTCGNSLPHITNVSTTGSTVENFALYCGFYDLSVTGISLLNGFYPGQEGAVLPHIGILNGSCHFGIPGKVKLVLTNCITFNNSSTNYPWFNQPNAVIPGPTGDTLVWNVSDINNIGNFGYFNFPAAITTCTNAQVGDTACITVMVLPTNGDANPANNSFTRCFAIGVSYDPNYKEVSPKGSGVEGFIPQNTQELTYTLHFQNTGTAPAHNIYLLDTLSNNLDVATIEIVASSHPMQPYLLPNRTMKFMFANIMLADSTHDELHSHGYVTYRIKLNGSLPLGTQIKNTGYIYFDYNAPVVTNTTLNTIAIPTGLKEASNQSSFNIYPNPAKDVLTVSLNNNENNTITITDVLGKEVLSQKTNGLSTELNVSNLQSGIYFVKVGGLVHKVMISK